MLSGPFRVGVRASSDILLERLAAVLDPVVEAEPEAPVNYSVRWGEGPKNKRSTGFHLLHRGSALVVRTRDPQRLLTGLIAHVDSHGHDYGDLLRVQGMALVGEQGALVVPAILREYIANFERRLNVRGVRIVDHPWAVVDWRTRELVVPEPTLPVDEGAIAEYLAAAPAGRDDPSVPPGRTPLIGWAFLGVGPHPSPAQAVAMGARLTAADPGDSLQEGLDRLAHLFGGISPFHLGWQEDPAVFARPLLDMMAAAP